MWIINLKLIWMLNCFRRRKIDMHPPKLYAITVLGLQKYIFFSGFSDMLNLQNKVIIFVVCVIYVWWCYSLLLLLLLPAMMKLYKIKYFYIKTNRFTVYYFNLKLMGFSMRSPWSYNIRIWYSLKKSKIAFVNRSFEEKCFKTTTNLHNHQ